MSILTPGGEILSKQLLDLLLQTNDSNVATFGNASNNVIMRVYDNNVPYAHKNYQFGIYGNNLQRSSNTFFITANNSNLTRVGFGTIISDTALEIYGNDALLLPKGSTQERPAPKKGQVRYNTELDLFEGYGTGNAWVPFGGVKNRDQSARIDAEFFAGSLDNNLRFFTCNQERMRILPTGNIGIGTTIPKVIMEINSRDAVLIPQGTSVQRPISTHVQKGMIRFNTDTQQFEGYGAGNTWGSLGGVKSTDQTTYISAELSAGTNDSNLRFFTGNNQHMIITNQGLVGIGTTTPTSKLHMVGDLIVTGTVEAGAYGSLYRVADTYATVPLSNINPQTQLRTVLTNDPNPTNRILYSFETTGGRFLVNGCIPYRNKSSLVAFNTTNWASISIHRLDIIPNTNPVQYETFTNATPAMQVAPMSIQTDEREYATQSINFFIQNIYPGRYVVALNGKGHELEFGGTVSDTSIFVIPIRGLGYEDSYDVRRAIQLSPIRFSRTIPIATPINSIIHSIDGNLIPSGSSNLGADLEIYIDGYRNGQKLTGQSWNRINPPSPPTDTDFYWYFDTILDVNQSKIIRTNTTIGFSNAPVYGNFDFTIWPTVTSSNVFQTGYFYQNAVRLGKIRVDPIYGNIGISASNTENLPGIAQNQYSLYVDGNSLFNGTLFASNLTILGEAVTLNTVTSNTEQLVITNAGTGPALTVTQTGPQPIADFYDDNNALALRVANDANIGIGTNLPHSKLSITSTQNGSKLTFFDNGSIINHSGFGISTNQMNYHVNQTTTDHVFYATGKNGDGTELMRLKGNGDLGVGITTLPSYCKTYFRKANAHCYLGIDSTTNESGIELLTNGAPKWQLYTPPSNNNLHILSELINKIPLTINGSNNYVGIGTVAPYSITQINQDQAQTPATSGSMNTGFILSKTPTTESLNMGCATDYTWIQSAQLTNAITNYPLSIQPTGGNVGLGTTIPRNHLHMTRPFTIGNPPNHNNNTVFYNSVYQWTGATYENPSSYNTNIITQNNANINTIGHIPNLILYNEHGGDNTTTGLAFASPEVTGSVAGKNSVTLGGIIAHKLSGTAGGWAKGGLTLYTKNNANRVDAMYVLNDGNVGIGTTTQLNFKLRVEGKTLINNDLLVTGDITGFYQLSDRRLKQNVQSIPSALDQVMQLRPVTFQWNNEVNQITKRGTPDVGLIAQEVRPHFPLVTEENMPFPSNYTDLMGIQYPKLIPYLIRSIQELNEKIKTLESRLPPTS